MSNEYKLVCIGNDLYIPIKDVVQLSKALDATKTNVVFRDYAGNIKRKVSDDHIVDIVTRINKLVHME